VLYKVTLPWETGLGGSGQLATALLMDLRSHAHVVYKPVHRCTAAAKVRVSEH